jgi:hypothetical protein
LSDVTREEGLFRKILDNDAGAQNPQDFSDAIRGAGEYLWHAFQQLAAAITPSPLGSEERAMEMHQACKAIEKALDAANQLQYVWTGREILPGRGESME